MIMTTMMRATVEVPGGAAAGGAVGRALRGALAPLIILAVVAVLVSSVAVTVARESRCASHAGPWCSRLRGASAKKAMALERAEEGEATPQ
jgi:hypothetical protein